MIPRRLIMVVAATIAITVFAPVAASACRIDYDGQDNMPGKYTLDIWFDCGVACGNYFNDIAPGSSVSRPGKAGKVQAQAAEVPASELSGGFCENVGAPYPDRASVGAHGEVALSFVGPLGEEKFTWVSKGGNSWHSPISHSAGYAVKTPEPCIWRGSP